MQGNNIFYSGINGFKNRFKTIRRNAYYAQRVQPNVSWLSRFSLWKNTSRNNINFHETQEQKQNKGFASSGGGTHPGAGIPMACLSGRHAAEMILKDLSLI